MPTSDTSPVVVMMIESPEELEAELEAHLDLFLRAIDAPPKFRARPAVAAVPGQPGRFALIDPATVDHTNPRAWNFQTAKTGLATRANPQGQSEFVRPTLGKAYAKSNPAARTYTAEELEKMQSQIDPEASGITVADTLSEGLYSQIVEAVAAAGVPPGARTSFVVRFVTQRIDLSVYGKQSTDEAKSAYLQSHVKHGIAAGQAKEPLFASYERRIIEAASAEVRRVEAPDAARISDLESKIEGLSATVLAFERKIAGLAASLAPPAK